MPNYKGYTEISSSDDEKKAITTISKSIEEELSETKKFVKTPLLKSLRGNSSDYGTCTKDTETSRSR